MDLEELNEESINFLPEDKQENHFKRNLHTLKYVILNDIC